MLDRCDMRMMRCDATSFLLVPRRARRWPLAGIAVAQPMKQRLAKTRRIRGKPVKQLPAVPARVLELDTTTTHDTTDRRAETELF